MLRSTDLARNQTGQLDCPACPLCGRMTRLVSLEPQIDVSVDVCTYQCACGHEVQRAYDRPRRRRS
jgi:hypothetical protein